MHTMTEAEQTERAKQKAMHKAIREALAAARMSSGSKHRIMLLVWGFVRGFNFRRIENRHHEQEARSWGNAVVDGEKLIERGGSVFYQHNMPSAAMLAETINHYCPDLAKASLSSELLKSEESSIFGSPSRTELLVKRWLAEPPLPKPPPRAKKPCSFKVDMTKFREAALRAAEGEPFEYEHAEPAAAIPEE